MTTPAQTLDRTAIVRMLVGTVARVADENCRAGETAMERLVEAFGDTPGLRRDLVEAVLAHDAADPPWGILADAQRVLHRTPSLRASDVALLGERLGVRDPGGISGALASPNAPDAVFCALFLLAAGYAGPEARALIDRLGLGPDRRPAGYRLGYERSDEGPFGMVFLTAPFALSTLAA